MRLHSDYHVGSIIVSKHGVILITDMLKEGKSSLGDLIFVKFLLVRNDGSTHFVERCGLNTLIRRYGTCII